MGEISGVPAAILQSEFDGTIDETRFVGNAIEAASAPPRIRPSNYPEPFASRMAGRIKRPLSDLFGLKNFGVNLTQIPPGAVSALITVIRDRTNSSTCLRASRRFSRIKVTSSFDPACVRAFRRPGPVIISSMPPGAASLSWKLATDPQAMRLSIPRMTFRP
jgi:hypothetical protein